MLEFKIPQLGENVDKGQIVKIMVSRGDRVKKEQDLFEIESEKASIPVPSPVEGTVKDILIKEGDEVKVGQVVLKIEEGGEGDKEEEKPDEKQQPSKEEAKQEAPKEKKDQPQREKPQPERPQGHEKEEESATRPRPETQKDARVAVIGGGPGGYAAAFLAADLGLKVTLIDKAENPGGVCLYRGCIPSKALLHAARVIAESREARDFGIEFGDPKIDLNKLRDWKNSVVGKLTGGLGQLGKKRGVRFVRGTASFVNSETLKIESSGGESQEIGFDYAIIATGSLPVRLPFAPDSKRILDSTSALDIEDVPEKFLVIGGGYIGLELGTVYSELGSAVTVVEMLPGILTGADRDLAAILAKRLKDRFAAIHLKTKVSSMEETDKGIKVTLEDSSGSKTSEIFDKVLMSVGRRPNTEGLGLENTKVVVNQKGFIEVDIQRRTRDERIFAIGDIAGDPLLAHKASHEGRVAAEAIAGHKAAFEPAAIPAVVFTDPEIAWCGLTETEAKEQGRDIKVVKFPWGASGRAVTLNRTDGVTKLIVDPETERIWGVAICGVGAGELISEGVIAVEMGCVVSDLKLSIHPHPTLSETVMESADVFFGQSAHYYAPKK